MLYRFYQMENFYLFRANNCWICIMEGPVCSPYEGGTFFIEIDLQHIPYPLVKFKTIIYHCNITKDGILSNLAITKTYTSISEYMEEVYRLLSECVVTNDPATIDIMRHYIHDRESYYETAIKWTRIFG